MIFILIGIALIVINVFTLSREKDMNDDSRQLFRRMHSRFPFIFREPGYCEDVGRVMNYLGLGIGVALIVWGVVS